MPPVSASEAKRRAEVALREFKSFEPFATAMARALSGNDKVTVKLSNSDYVDSKTDGKTIYISPFASFYEVHPHDRYLCDKRGPDMQMLCPECYRQDGLFSLLYHEIAHIAYNSMISSDPITRSRAPWQRASWLSDEKKAALDRKNMPGMKYIEMAQGIGEFYPLLLNAMEDVRIEAQMCKVRANIHEMMLARNLRMSNFAEVGMSFKEKKPNFQIIVAIMFRASGMTEDKLIEAFHPKIVADSAAPEVLEYLEQVEGMASVRQVFLTLVDLYNHLITKGYFEQEKEDDKEEESQEDESSGDSSEEAPEQPGDESDDLGDGSGDDDGGESGDDVRPDESGDSPAASDEELDAEDGDGEGAPGDSQDESQGEGSTPSDNPSESESGSEGTGGESDSGDGEASPSEGGEPSGDGNGDSSPGSEVGDAPGESSGDVHSGAPGSPSSPGDSGEDQPAGREDSVPDSDTGDGGGDDSDSDGMEDSDPGQGDGGSEGMESGESESSGGEGSESSDGDPQGGRESVEDSDDSGQASGEGSGGEGSEASQEDGEVPGTEDGGSGDGQSSKQADFTDNTEADYTDPEERRTKPPTSDYKSHGKGQSGDIVEIPDYPDDFDFGSVEEVKGELDRLLGHDSNHDDGLLHDAEETPLADPATRSEIKQQAFKPKEFDRPSPGFGPVERFTYDLRTGQWTNEDGDSLSRIERLKSGFGGSEIDDLTVESLAPPSAVMGKHLFALRLVFEKNKRGAQKRGLRSGKVNPSVLGKRAPIGDPRLFRKKSLPKHRDYHVVLHIDASGSTGEDVQHGPYQRVMTLQKRAVFAQAELLDRLGIKFTILAGTGLHGAFVPPGSSSREALWTSMVLEVKGVDQPWNAASKTALAKLPIMQGNLDGHAMQICLHETRQVKVTDHIIMYYTDGAMPMANRKEELEFLKRSVATAQKENITLMGVGIQTDSPKAHGLDTVQINSADDIGVVISHLGKRLGE